MSTAEIRGALKLFALIFASIILTVATAGRADAVTVINTVQDLQNIQNNLAGSYVLGSDIDASGFGFVPIGSAATPFTGTFDGKGHTIRSLVFTAGSQVGVFGYVGNSGIVQNVTLAHVFVPKITVFERHGICAGATQ